MTTDRLPFKNRWGRTLLCTALCIACVPFLSLTLFIPKLLTAIPLAVIFLFGFAGPVCAALGTAIITAGSSLLLSAWDASMWGVVGCIIFIVPLFIATLLTLYRREDFWLSAGIGAAVMFASCCVIIGIIGARSGTDAVTAIMQAMVDLINRVEGLPEMLIEMTAQMGLLEQGTGALDASGRNAILQTMIRAADMVMRLRVPAQITTGSLAAGVLSQFMLRKTLNRNGLGLSYPALRTWRLPKGWGRILALTFAALFLITQVVPQYTSGMLYVFTGLFEQVFTLQGIAALCWVAYEKGRGGFWQAMIFMLGYFLLSTPASLIGIADQAFDFSHRREKLGNEDTYNPFDPRAKRDD